jgi:hypothetical protein
VKSNLATTFSPTWIGRTGSDAARSRFEGKQIFGRADLPLDRMDAHPPSLCFGATRQRVPTFQFFRRAAGSLQRVGLWISEFASPEHKNS